MAGSWRPGCAFALVGLLAGCFSPAATDIDDDDSGTDTSGDTTTGASTASASMTSAGSLTTSGPSTSMTASATNGTTDTTTTNGTTDTTTTTTDGSTGAPTCASDEVCVPQFPVGWTGPVVLEDPDTGCPGGFSTLFATANGGLVEGIYQCGCQCNIASVNCQLFLENSNQAFNPSMSCQEPPFNDECLAAVPQASCNDNGVDVPGEPAWNQTQSVCSGALPQGMCAEGSCYADPGGDLCLAQEGDLECPAGFGDRTVYYQDFEDTRECSACSCSPSGQSCEIDVEICSISFFDVTLDSDQNCFQLNSSDGDGVTFQSTSITDQGGCSADGGAGELSGEVTTTEPLTVCCME